MEFAVSAQPKGDGVVVIDVHGEVDVYTAPKLRDEINKQYEQGATSIVVDLKDVAYMDSSGLGVLIGALKKARLADGELIVAAPNARISRILEVTQLSQIFNVQPDTPAALAALKGKTV